MKFLNPIILFSLLLLSRCNSKIKSEGTTENYFDHQFSIIKSISPVAGPDVAIIKSGCYIECFDKLRNYYDDTLKDPRRLRIENNRQDYYINIDTYGFYLEELQPILDSSGLIRVNLRKEQKYVQLESQNGEIYYLKLSQYKLKPGVLIFNGKSNPRFWHGHGFDKEALRNFLQIPD